MACLSFFVFVLLHQQQETHIPYEISEEVFHKVANMLLGADLIGNAPLSEQH